MYVLFSRQSSGTGRAIRAELNCHGGMPNHYREQRESLRVVRWGCSSGEDSAITLNSKEAVALAANKLQSLRLMKEAGCDVPRFDIAPTGFDEGAIIFGRKTSGYGGRDVEVLDGPHTRAIYSDFFTEFVPSVREMRLHIFQGELIGAQNKRYVGSDEEDATPIRNHDRGYVFVPLIETRPHEKRIAAAAKAVEALGLDFGAVDMLVTADDRSVVLEVNSAPGLSDRYLDAYVEAIASWSDPSS
jgi:hypothetical protein